MTKKIKISIEYVILVTTVNKFAELIKLGEKDGITY